MNSILYFFTQAISSALTLARIATRSVLPNLYLVNRRDDSDVELIYSGDFPNLYPQAYGNYLDLLGFSFNVERLSGENDFDYRERIIFSLQQNSTKEGIENSISTLLGYCGFCGGVTVIENTNNFFDAETTSLDVPLRDYKGSMLYSINIVVEPTTFRYGFREPIYYQYFENVFEVELFKTILDDVISSGVEIESVTFLAPGTGGQKGDFYAHEN